MSSEKQPSTPETGPGTTPVFSSGDTPATAVTSSVAGTPDRVVLDARDIARALTRIAHEILERNKGAADLVLLGIPRRGVPLAQRVADRIAAVEGATVAVGSLDVTMYRDDLRLRPARALLPTEIPHDGIDGKVVVLVDDVLYSGRTIRAALDALNDLGRPQAVRLAVLVDRGHRELPIRADFVGKNLPTSLAENVEVRLSEYDDADAVVITGGAAPSASAAATDPTSTGTEKPPMMKHLLSAGDLTRDDAELVLATAEELRSLADRPIKKLPALRGRTVVNLFFEDSTRTRISFEAAAKRLSADVINFAAKGSSVSKGESLKDTALTLEAMGADAIVIRHGSSGAPHRLAHTGWTRSSVINAGDGTHEHPTQALLDAFTMWRHLGSLDGRRIALVGDVLHSRVARSNALLLRTLGAEVTLVAPPTLLPVGVEGWDVETSYDIDSVLPKADAVMMLRVQRERMNAAFFPTVREYSRRYGLDSRRMGSLQEHALIMHPGPMVRGMEITADVADSSRSVIVEQVTNGVAVRMAVLYLLLGGSGPAGTTTAAPVGAPADSTDAADATDSTDASTPPTSPRSRPPPHRSTEPTCEHVPDPRRPTVRRRARRRPGPRRGDRGDRRLDRGRRGG